jgi:chromosome segregation ATPase
MPFDVAEYLQLVELLYKRPEWRAELRQLLLSEDILNLPQVVRELAEAQKRTEQRVEELAKAQKRTEQRVEELAEAQKRTEQRVEELAEAQKRSEERIGRLEIAVAELAEAQKRTEQCVEELAEAQKRTEQRVEELAEAQKRSEERIGRLEIAVAELAEAQKRTEQRVEELAEAQKRSEERIGRLEIAVAELAEAQKRTEQKVDRLASELGGLKALIGASLEEEATAVTETVMRQKGYRLLEEASTLRLNGEVDVILRIEDPQGRQITVVAEAKTRLSRRDVIAWAQRMRSAGWRKRLEKAGYPAPYWVYAYAIRADRSAKEAVREIGIGLIKGEGEVIAPVGWIE